MIKRLRVAPLALLISGLAISTLALANEPIYNQISLRAEASQEVAHDQMQVILYTEAQDTDPARLATAISTTLNNAVATARKQATVNVKLG